MLLNKITNKWGQYCLRMNKNIYNLTQDIQDVMKHTLKTLLIWSISDLPGNKGFCVRSSPNIQPTDHMSTAVEYSWEEETRAWLKTSWHDCKTHSLPTAQWATTSTVREQDQPATRGLHGSTWIRKPKVRPDECLGHGSGSVLAASGLG